MKKGQAKHKLCRRLGYCIWNMPKCPTTKERAYPAGQHGKSGKKRKLSTYGEMMQEKQKLRAHYAISEKQLEIAYANAKKGEGRTNEKLMRNIELRLDAIVYHSGLAPSIFAAKQYVAHRHILVDGKVVNKGSYKLKPQQVVTLDAERSPSLAEAAKASNTTAPAYVEVDRENLKVTVLRAPEISEIPFQVEAMRIVEYYAR